MTLNELRVALQTLDERDLAVSPAGRLVVDVALGERRQKVRIRAEGPWFRLESRICSADAGTTRFTVSQLAGWVLSFNRDQEFLALARDADGYLIGRVDLPHDLALGDLVDLLRRLAAECDRAEARITGMDQ